MDAPLPIAKMQSFRLESTMDLPIITYSEGKAAGLLHYFTGRPCKHGHISKRKVSDRSCTECCRLRANVYYWNAPEKNHANCARYRASNPEKIKADKAAYRAQHRDKEKATQAAYRARTTEKRKAQAAVWYAKNEDKRKATRKEWVKNNYERVLTTNRNRHAKKKAAEGYHTKEDVLRILDAQKNKCACCKTKVSKKYHVDHIQPLAKGGSNWPSNLQILCPSCNSGKCARDPIEFMQSRGMLL
jgi:hypothetical protein